MKYKAHEYQEYATKFIEDNEESAVFLECGLGKSVITLTAIKNLMARGEVNRVLVVAPLRVGKTTWPEEIGKWDHLTGLTYAVAIGTVAERLSALKAKADITIINRENVEWLIDKSGVPFDYDMLVIDELSSFKSFKAKRFKALLKVRPYITRVVGLQAHLPQTDLWTCGRSSVCLTLGRGSEDT